MILIVKMYKEIYKLNTQKTSCLYVNLEYLEFLKYIFSYDNKHIYNFHIALLVMQLHYHLFLTNYTL